MAPRVKRTVTVFSIVKWTLVHMIPFWIRYFLPMSGAYDEGRVVTGFWQFWRDLIILLTLWKRTTLNIFVSVLGVPNRPGIFPFNFFGTADYTELALTKRMVWEATKLGIWTVFGFIFIIISLIPIICIAYPIYTWWQTLFSNAGWIMESDYDELNKVPYFVSRNPEWNSLVNSRECDSEWFYINGVANTKFIALKGISRINQLFQIDQDGTPPRATLLYNPTQGVFLDLLESFLGRTFDWPGIPGQMAYLEIGRAMKRPNVKRIALIGHSQGCIILASFLSILEKRFDADGWKDEHLAKLEVYLFASAADHVPNLNGRVYIEHFANKDDLVAQLGILNPLPKRGEEEMKHVFYNATRRGHVLNEHYLKDFEKRPYTSLIDSGVEPRLYSYLKKSKEKKLD